MWPMPDEWINAHVIGGFIIEKGQFG